MRELKVEQIITRRDTDSVNRYLGEIGRIPLLTVAEEVMLSRRVREGDEAALEYLVRTNLRFVVSVAKKYQNRGLSLGDLINEGNLGLIKAAKRFDDTKGFKFISFAVWWIRQSIMLAIAEHTRVIRLPLNLVNSITRLNRITLELEQKLERKPSSEEVAEEINQEKLKVSDQLIYAKKCKSLDAVVNPEIGSTLLDVLAAEAEIDGDTFLFGLDEHALHQMMIPLTGREKKVIQLYYGLGGLQPQSLHEIGALYHISKERTRQLKDQGIKKMRMKVPGKS